MRRLAILAAASLLSVAATGCDDTRVITTPDPIPTRPVGETPPAGQCADGRDYVAGEHCP